MPNLIVISSIIFPCMYVGLTVRDECERLVKNQVSNVDQVDFVTVSREATHEKATCRAHDWKMKSHARLEIFASVSWVRPTHKRLAKLSIWQKVVFCFT